MTLIFAGLGLLIVGLYAADKLAAIALRRSSWLRWWCCVEDSRESRAVLGRVSRKRIAPLP